MDMAKTDPDNFFLTYGVRILSLSLFTREPGPYSDRLSLVTPLDRTHFVSVTLILDLRTRPVEQVS